MIKLIVTDVDGVIVGHKEGVNFPYPNKKVVNALRAVSKKGIPVVLCSGKYYHAIELIIRKAGLKNPHITDSGALIINTIEGKITHTFTIPTSTVSKIIEACIKNKIYVEVFSVDDYFIQKDQMNEFTSKRTLILQRDPIVVDSLLSEIKKHEIIKLIPISNNFDDRKRVENAIFGFNDRVNFNWSQHPFTMPLQYCLTTSKDASKTNAITEVAKSLGVGFENILGIGDTMGDWEYMKLCGYVATMEDASEELKELVQSKGEGNYKIAPSVDSDGFIDILDFFINSK